MAELILQFALSAGVIVVAGTFLAKAADSIAELTKLGRLVVGSVFLAGATSLPEISVDISAVRAGMPDLAVGDLMGSSLSNLLILAIADLMHKSSEKIFSKASGAHALSGAISINMTAVAAIMLYLGPRFPAFELAGIGLGPFVIVIAYVFGLRLLYFDQKLFVAEKFQAKAMASQMYDTLPKAIGVFAVSTVAILIVGPYMAESAGEIADVSGLGKTFIGSTLVAFSTSLPELVSTIVAVRMGAFDLAVGNVFGSNCFNMLILFVIDPFYPGPILESVSPSHVVTALAVIMATSIAIMGQLYQVENRKKFIEPDAFIVIGLVIAALLMLYYFGTV